MVESELLQEKDRIQKKLAEDCTTIREYLKRSQLAARALAKLHGFSLQYVEATARVPDLKIPD